MLRNRGIVMPHRRPIIEKGLSMKKNRDSSDLAARNCGCSEPAGGKEFCARASGRTNVPAGVSRFDACCQDASCSTRASAFQVQKDQTE
jgi:hypothetical protein